MVMDGDVFAVAYLQHRFTAHLMDKIYYLSIFSATVECAPGGAIARRGQKGANRLPMAATARRCRVGIVDVNG